MDAIEIARLNADTALDQSAGHENAAEIIQDWRDNMMDTLPEYGIRDDTSCMRAEMVFDAIVAGQPEPKFFDV